MDSGAAARPASRSQACLLSIVFSLLCPSASVTWIGEREIRQISSAGHAMPDDRMLIRGATSGPGACAQRRCFLGPNEAAAPSALPDRGASPPATRLCQRRQSSSRKFVEAYARSSPRETVRPRCSASCSRRCSARASRARSLLRGSRTAPAVPARARPKPSRSHRRPIRRLRQLFACVPPLLGSK